MNNFLRENKEILQSMSLIIVPLIILFSVFTIVQLNKGKEVVVEEVIEERLGSNPFEGVDIIARSAIVKDLNTGDILYAKEANTPRPLASITKVMTALFSEESDRRKVVSISLDDLNNEGDSQLSLGEIFFRDDLVSLTLVSSSNDGASALAAGAINFSTTGKENFIEGMNSIAMRLGMENSRFYNETGLDDSEFRAGAHGSASDIVKLFEYVIQNKPEILEPTRQSNISVSSISGLVHNVDNTNLIVGKLPNTIASKTGYTDLAGGNLAVVIDPSLNRPFAIVVLGSTEEGRFEDVTLLAEKVTEYLSYISN